MLLLQHPTYAYSKKNEILVLDHALSILDDETLSLPYIMNSFSEISLKRDSDEYGSRSDSQHRHHKDS